MDDIYIVINTLSPFFLILLSRFDAETDAKLMIKKFTLPWTRHHFHHPTPIRSPARRSDCYLVPAMQQLPSYFPQNIRPEWFVVPLELQKIKRDENVCKNEGNKCKYVIKCRQETHKPDQFQRLHTAQHLFILRLVDNRKRERDSFVQKKMFKK